jgi:hypothetical protein
MTDGADNNGELPTLEQIQQTVTEIAAMGLIYDTGRRRKVASYADTHRAFRASSRGQDTWLTFNVPLGRGPCSKACLTVI